MDLQNIGILHKNSPVILDGAAESKKIMKCFDLYMLKKLTKDAVAVNFWNRKTIERFKKKKYVNSLGIAQKGKAKGRECVLLLRSGEEYFEKLQQERKESFRFWVALWMNPVSAIIGAITGFILAKYFS